MIAGAVQIVHVPVIQAAPSRPQKRRLIAHRASDLQPPEKLIWVWPGRIPEGKLVLLGGPPGLGKSQLTAFMAATVSNGGLQQIRYRLDQGDARIRNRAGMERAVIWFGSGAEPKLQRRRTPRSHRAEYHCQ